MSMDDSAYDELLIQVENLKIENKLLKRELSTNTSLINRLESQASDLKQMVIQLGKSINSATLLENNVGTQPSCLPSSSSSFQAKACSTSSNPKPAEQPKAETLRKQMLNSVANNARWLGLRSDESTTGYLQMISDVNKKLVTLLDENQSEFTDMAARLECHDLETLLQTYSALSASPNGSAVMRKAGCLPLLVTLLHEQPTLSLSLLEGKDNLLQVASQALQNLVVFNPNPEQKQGECQIFKHLQVVQSHCDNLRRQRENIETSANNELLKSLHVIMGHSYYKPARGLINKLGGLHCVAHLFVFLSALNRNDEHVILQHQCMGSILVNLTFGDTSSKVVLMKVPGMLAAILSQLKSDSEDIQQAMASLLRNLSWQADDTGKEFLQGVAKILTEQLQSIKSETTVKSFLGALWNLSSHSSSNRAEICAVDGALSFLLSLLSYTSPTKSLNIVENAGGILRNISSIIVKVEAYRKIVRDGKCFEILLSQLESPSLTVVCNACVTLWNLSWRNVGDQKRLIELGAVEKLKKLVHSKHKLISEGSIGALSNLLNKSSEARMVNQRNAETRSTSNVNSQGIQLHGLQQEEQQNPTFRSHEFPTGLRRGSSQSCSKQEEARSSSEGLEEAVRRWGKRAVSSDKIMSNLERTLQHQYDDYSVEDDNPVNYSLQYSELSSSPKPNMCSKGGSASDGFLTQPGPATAPGGSRPAYRVDSNLSRANINVEEKVMRADKHVYDSEDTPTNFGAIYTEENLDEECLESADLAKEGGDCVKTYHVEDTPICFSTRSSMTDLHASTNKPPESTHDECPSDEADDKFDTGAITPAHYFKSNRPSGLMTPRTPLFQDTPMMMYSPTESRSSLESCDQASIHSDVSSVPESRLQSGYISASELPDSPGQSMPQSRCRSPFDQQKAKDKCNGALESGLGGLKGLELIKKAHAMSPGYLATLPQKDEIKSYLAEPAMSVMTGLSGLTMDGERIQPLLAFDVANTNNNNLNKDNNMAVLQAGYVTSLPTSDEIKHYYMEGSMSPFTGLSEISALHSHNEGFQRGLAKLRASNSCTSRSSATGASFPLPPVSQQDKTNKESTDATCSKEAVANESLSSKQSKETNAESVEVSGNAGYSTSMPSCDEIKVFCHDMESPVTTLSEISALKLDNDGFQKAEDTGAGGGSVAFSDFLDSSSDDDGLLEKVIESAIPKNRSSSRSKSSKSSGSRKEKPNKKQAQKISAKKLVGERKSIATQQPGTKIDTRERIATANARLNGMDIVEYIEKKMAAGDGDSAEERKPKGKRVIEAAESLGPSYSVMTELRREGKVVAQNRPTTFHTEDTPVEISRCTSLSDLTIESEPKNLEFGALKGMLANDPAEGVANHNPAPASPGDDVTKKEAETAEVGDETIKDEEGSSLSFSMGSDDGLLIECITSAMPVARKNDEVQPKQLVEDQDDVPHTSRWPPTSSSTAHEELFPASGGSSAASSLKLGGDARSYMKSISEGRKRTGRADSAGSRRNDAGSSPCNNCKASNSTSKLSQHRRPRKSSTHTRYSNAVDQRRPARSRSAHTGCYSTGVTQIYPRVKEIDSIVFSGLASMAARGEKVQCGCGQWTHACHPQPILQPTFIKQAHSQPFLQNQIVQNARPVSKPAKNPSKKKSLKTRFKKLISSGGEKKSADKKRGEASNSSSLTLSSSSTGSHSSASMDAYRKQQSGRNIYPTVSSITANHVPKSPISSVRLLVRPRHPPRTTGASGSSSSLTSAAARKKPSK